MDSYNFVYCKSLQDSSEKGNGETNHAVKDKGMCVHVFIYYWPIAVIYTCTCIFDVLAFLALIYNNYFFTQLLCGSHNQCLDFTSSMFSLSIAD